MTIPEPDYLDPNTISVSKPDAKRRFNEIKSWLLDREAMLEELCSERTPSNGDCGDVWHWPQSHQRTQERWDLLDEQWLQLRPLVQYASFAELEAAYIAANVHTRKHPRSLKALDHMSRLKVLWLACVDDTTD